jgi:cation diffusion facilitator family transporter
MSDTCQSLPPALETPGHRRVLTIALLINAAMFAVEFAAGSWAESTALIADSFDMLGDALVYGISLYAITRGARWQARAALTNGVFELSFGLAATAEVIRRAVFGSDPVAGVMILVAAVALVANLACALLLMRHRHDNINLHTVWLCTRNDILSNAGVIVAAVLVTLLGARWPDLLVGALIAAVFLHTGVSVLLRASRALRASSRV